MIRKFLNVTLVMLIMFLAVDCAKKQIKKDGVSGDQEEADGGTMGVGRTSVVEIGQSGGLVMVHFDFDQYTLSEEAREMLKQNAQWLKDNKKIKVQIEGHCDSRGTQQYNLALGQKRADFVRHYLMELGIESSRLATISYGEDHPLVTGEEEEAWAKNRRAEFVITKI